MSGDEDHVAAPGHDSAAVGQPLRSKRSLPGGNFGIRIRSQAARETQILGADDLQVARRAPSVLFWMKKERPR